ncbi:MAG: hypothetical protein JSV06_07860 [Myxococcales bacterium]|nr:MAG: hypothetical protein JSV06_07860 [Myxococcales bacterium]
MKRFAPIVVLAVSLAIQSPSPAAASENDIAAFDVLFGGTTAKFAGQRKWQPTLWLDGTAGVAGPLHLGAYFQWLGRSWPLEDPGFGGGGMIALRPNVKKLRITGAFTGGYLKVPLPMGSEGAGTIGALFGLGYSLLDWMGVEVRGRWMRYFRMPDGAPQYAWSIEAGFSFFVK